MDRTAEVRQRLWPIMERMKKSLDKMESLEDSIAARQEANRNGTSSDYVTQHPECASVPSQPVDRVSKRLRNDSAMNMKKKLDVLQRMEETLSSQEDRRQILQHHIIQASLSMPCLEICEEKKLDNNANQRFGELRTTCHQSLDGHGEEARSLGTNAPIDEVVEKLREAMEKNRLYEHDLQDRQSKINTLSIRCDDLELQVEYLREICESLKNPDNIADAGSQGSSDLSSQDSSDAPPKLIGDNSQCSTALTRSDEDSLTVFSSAILSAIGDRDFSHHMDEDIPTHFLAKNSSDTVIRSLLTRVGHLERSDAELKRFVLNKSTTQCPSKKPYGKFIFGFRSPEMKRNDRLEKARLISEGLAAAHSKPMPP